MLNIRKIDPSSFETSYGVKCQRIFPSPESGATPFNAFWTLIEPGKASQLHRHHEGETFIIVKGQGVMTVGDESAPVEVGDVIFMKPLVDHTLANSSETDELLMLNVYWEDIELLLRDDEDTSEPKGVRTIAYPSPPNPNGDLHLGHLSGPVLSADMFIRHRRMLGDPAFFVIGTDDNQVWTASMAESRGETPQQCADHFANRIADTMAKAHIDCKHFFRPNATAKNKALLEEFVTKLWKDGHLVARDAPSLVCENCDDLYLFEVRVSGGCPHCGKSSCGNACEECGLPNQVVDLIDPKCKQCGGTPVEKPVRRLYFPLEPHRAFLEQYHRKASMTSQHRALIKRLMDGPMPEIVSSHISPWGLPVPIEGFDGHCVSAWLEMLPGYLAGAEELAEQEGIEGGWRAFWGSGKDARVVQFFGYDNCWNHGVLYPAVLNAFDPTATPPVGFVSNQLYRLDNSKFSTSRNHAVWTRDIVDLNSPDTVRCYAAHTCPEAEQTNYSLAEFADFVNRELLGNWQGWMAEAQGRIDGAFEGKTPEAGAWTDRHLAFMKRLKNTLDQAKEAYSWETYSPQRLSRLAIELVRSARDFGRAEEAWGNTSAGYNEQRTAIALELAALRTLAMIVTPLMPDFAAHLGHCLGYDQPITRWENEPHFVTPGQKISGLADDYFPAPVTEKPAA